jgi:hypothetical protein
MKPTKLQSLRRLGLPIDFPADFLPRSAEAFRRMIAKSADTPDDFAVAHILAAATTAIGKNVRARPQSTWSVGANLFMALIGFKGAGKSSLASATFGPLLQHEDSLAANATEAASPWDDDEDQDEYNDELQDDEEWDDCEDDEPLKTPPVIVTDVTGPAVVRVLELEPRQLLVHTDELAAVFIKNTGGTDRQVYCELADGRRRRQSRATRPVRGKAIESPHVCLLGCLTPDLLATAYAARGDDGFLDRFLLVGDGESRRPSWPQDVHDPDLTAAWSQLIDRLLRIEAESLDSVDGKLDVSFDPEAIDRFRHCIEQLNLVADAVRMPEAQRGVVNKMRGFLPKFALIRRCLRWAVGEFGAEGPAGTIDAADAEAACQAVMFFFGRWLLWRPELRAGLLPSGEPIGLQGDPGEDPALQTLARTAATAQVTVLLVERLVRYLRHTGGRAVLAEMRATGPMATATAADVHDACCWLVEHEHAEWADGQNAILLKELPTKRSRVRRQLAQVVPAS